MIDRNLGTPHRTAGERIRERQAEERARSAQAARQAEDEPTALELAEGKQQEQEALTKAAEQRGDEYSVPAELADAWGNIRQTDHFRDLQDSRDDSQEWPQPLALGVVLPPPPFPLDVLPGPMRRLVMEGASALPCPPDYIAVPTLALAGGAIGNARALAIKPRHVQPAVLYVAVVGPPGSAKTPALELAAQPAHEEEARLRTHWDVKLKHYETRKEAYDLAKKAATKKAGQEPAELFPEAEPVRPVLTRLTVNDTTTEGLGLILQENPRGIVMIRDELIGWVKGMNAYRAGGAGADQQFWLSCWSCATATVDRKMSHEKGPLRIPRPFVGVAGGLTPEKLPTLRGDVGNKKADDDGFLDRILFAYPVPLPASGETWETIGDDTARDYGDMMERLRLLGMVEEQHDDLSVSRRPFVVGLTQQAREVWQTFTEGHAKELNDPAFPEHLRGPWSKLRGYCGRLALIVHFLRWAAGEFHDDRAAVDDESMRRAVELVAYFKGQARRVYACMDADREMLAARKLWAWIVRERRVTFKRHEANEDLRSDRLFPRPDSLDRPLEILAQHNLIRERPAPTRQGPGRKPATTYEVNPLGSHPENPVNPGNGPDDAA